MRYPPKLHPQTQTLEVSTYESSFLSSLKMKVGLESESETLENEIFYLITYRVSRTSTLPSCLQKHFIIKMTMTINNVIKMTVTLMIISEPEDCVLELVPLKTASSNVNARHYKVPLAEIEKVLKFIVFFLQYIRNL